MAATDNTALAPQLNWAAMFAAYAQGSSLEDVAETWGCPLATLREVSRTQEWPALASRVAVPQPTRALQTSSDFQRLARLEANREANMSLAEDLRSRLAHDFRQLKNGTLRVQKAIAQKGVVTIAELDPGPADLLALATAAQRMSELTYRALGDVPADERSKQSSFGDVGQITVILPSVVVSSGGPELPRAQTQVIDLRPADEMSLEESMAKARADREKAIQDTVDQGPQENFQP